MLMYFPVCHPRLPVFAAAPAPPLAIFARRQCETHVQGLLKVSSKPKSPFSALTSTTFVPPPAPPSPAAVEPSQRGSSYGSLITAHGKYQLFAKTGYFKVSEFWHSQLLRAALPPTRVHTRRASHETQGLRESVWVSLGSWFSRLRRASVSFSSLFFLFLSFVWFGCHHRLVGTDTN